MAEIKTLDEAKAKIGQQVKFAYNEETMSKDLKGVATLTGIIRTINSQWEHTKEGDNLISFSYGKIDVVDPNVGGLHYLKPERVFTTDTKDSDIINVAAVDEIAKLQARIDEMLANIKAKV